MDKPNKSKTVDYNTLSRLGEVVNRIAEIRNQLDAVKPLYEELDVLTLELQTISGSPSSTPKYQTNTTPVMYVSVVDNFLDRNTVFRPTGVRRFESLVQTEEDVQKEQAKLEKAAKKALSSAS